MITFSYHWSSLWIFLSLQSSVLHRYLDAVSVYMRRCRPTIPPRPCPSPECTSPGTETTLPSSPSITITLANSSGGKWPVTIWTLMSFILDSVQAPYSSRLVWRHSRWTLSLSRWPTDLQTIFEAPSWRSRSFTPTGGSVTRTGPRSTAWSGWSRRRWRWSTPTTTTTTQSILTCPDSNPDFFDLY